MNRTFANVFHVTGGAILLDLNYLSYAVVTAEWGEHVLYSTFPEKNTISLFICNSYHMGVSLFEKDRPTYQSSFNHVSMSAGGQAAGRQVDG